MSDWPQWRGPARNGISPETGWNSRWSGSGPRQLWKARTGQGFSSMVVKAGKLYTMGNHEGQDYVLCYDALTGKLPWQHTYRCDPGDYGGPRATPVVHNNNVYTLSREGLALCLNAQSGKPVWERQIAREIGAPMPQWGFAGSPLIQGNLVVYNIGGSGTALDKSTGRIVWKSSGIAGYASPMPFSAGGQDGVAIFAGKGLVAVHPKTGRVLWQHPWDTSYDVNAADPLFSGNSVFISSNYGKGGALLRLSGGRPTVAWQNRSMRNHFSTSVLLNGAIFGNDENTLRCINLSNGEERWEMRGMGKGGLIAADGKLIVLTERGDLVLVEATTARFNELARARVLTGTCWTHPVLANGLVYCRSHEGNLVCLDVRR